MTTSNEKEGQRKVLALIICLFLAFLYAETVWKPYFQGQQQTSSPVPTPTSPVGEQQGPQPTSSQAVSPQQKQVAPTSPAEAAKKTPSDIQIMEQGIVAIDSGEVTASISLLGGRLIRALMDNYSVTLDNPSAKLDLVKHSEYAPYPLGVISNGVDDSKTVYRVISPVLTAASEGKGWSLPLNKEGPTKLVLQGTLPDGREITKTFAFSTGSFFIDLDVQISRPAADSSPVAVEWTKVVEPEDGSILDPYSVHGYVWFDGEKAQREAFKDFTADRLDLGPVNWVSMADKYFMATLFSKEAKPGTAVREGAVYASRLFGGPQSISLSVFVGPKSYELLSSIGYKLQRNIDFGKTAFISEPLLWLLEFLQKFVGNYGLAIVILTIIVRMCLYPLNVTSFKQMKAMQDLKPELDRIREQVKEKQQQQIEQMALYKKKGVNPLGGCLPVLIQMPVFIGLYSALQLAVDLRHAPYALWIRDLSAPEALMIGGVAVPVMVILFVISMLVQQWITPSSMDPTQKKVMMVMPIVFGFMFAKFPAGLTLYWLTNNLISISQQRAMYSMEDKHLSALAITTSACVVVFLLAFVVTLF